MSTCSIRENRTLIICAWLLAQKMHATLSIVASIIRVIAGPRNDGGMVA